MQLDRRATKSHGGASGASQAASARGVRGARFKQANQNGQDRQDATGARRTHVGSRAPVRGRNYTTPAGARTGGRVRRRVRLGRRRGKLRATLAARLGRQPAPAQAKQLQFTKQERAKREFGARSAQQKQQI